jgi:hypothetical protein
MLDDRESGEESGKIDTSNTHTWLLTF